MVLYSPEFFSIQICRLCIDNLNYINLNNCISNIPLIAHQILAHQHISLKHQHI